ncbi:divinyl protochlorophyllide a 8-vinyl-reductase [Thermoflexales bacterium]|nr:divinyl protochlorophyllide a 8-vinyl-reductase [Thermoflexales bacterium]
MRLALFSTELTLGKSGYHAVVHVSGLDRLLDSPPPGNTKLETPGEDFSALLSSVLNMYGEVTTRGIFRRWGATFGEAAVRRRPSALLLKPMLALLPLQRRVRAVLDALVNEADVTRGEMLHTLTDNPDQYLLSFRDCLYCAGMHPAEPICFTVVGTLEAVLKWGTGRDFAVREVRCSARGDGQCVFEIDKQPLHV